MPTLIRWADGRAELAEDPFTTVIDDMAGIPPGDVIISMSRFQIEGERLLGEGRKVGVRVEADQAVEDLAYDLWPDNPPVVVAAPDAKRGERIVMATTKRGATRAEVQAWMKIKGASEIMAPAAVLVLDVLPLLGSGKVDYIELAKIMRERIG